MNGVLLAHLAGACWPHHQDPKFAHDGNVSCGAKLLFHIGGASVLAEGFLHSGLVLAMEDVA